MKESASEKERESQDAFSLREHNLTRNVNCVGVRECVVLVGFLRGKEKNTSGGGGPVFILRGLRVEIRWLSANAVARFCPTSARSVGSV